MNCYNCFHYVAGLLAVFAYDDISYSKIATQSQTYSGKGYDATNAVDGNMATCTRTFPIGATNPNKTTWWKVDLGGVFSIYCVNLQFKSYDGYGCKKASFYGSKCDKPCPSNCKDNTCTIQNGSCFLCKAGWSGSDCDIKCSKGWYGMNCAKQCVGHCRDGVTCNHGTGLCDRGCAAGWKGDLCNKECNGGTYGYNCAHNCSGNCLNESPCNKQTGLCDRGCNPGYTNSNCSKECLPGYFGIDCNGKCSGHCVNNEPCDHVSGVCPSGCQDGFDGPLCNKSCNKGYFGTHCSGVCSPNCQYGQCRHKDGSCISCAQGWKGYNCTTENVLEIQSISSSIMLAIGLSVSILINIIFIVCGILLWRRNKSSKGTLFGNLPSRWKTSPYQDIVVKNDETSTYQELDLSDSAYQNTALP